MDTTTVRTIFEIDPTSPIGQLFYPVVVLLLTNLVKLLKPLVARYRDGSIHIGALLLGVLSATMAEGKGWTVSSILSGLLVGLAAIGGWETIGKRLVSLVQKLGPTAILAIPILGVLLGGTALAKPIYDPSRLSLGAGATATVYEDRETGERSSAAVPHGYLSWSLTDRFSVAGVGSYDFNGKLGIVQGGLRFSLVGFLPEDKAQIGFGIDGVRYLGDGAYGYEEKTSWLASVRLSWSVWRVGTKDVLWAVAQVETDPENGTNGRTFYRIGLRWQALGGK